MIPHPAANIQAGATDSIESTSTGGAADTGSEVLFDVEKLEHRIGRNADLLRDLISLFLSNQPKDVKTLRHAIDTGELARCSKQAHRIAGSFASLAMDILARQALQIEHHAAAGHLDACRADMAELETRFEIAKREMGKALGRLTNAAGDKS